MSVVAAFLTVAAVGDRLVSLLPTVDRRLWDMRAIYGPHVPTLAITVHREARSRAMIVKNGVGGAPLHS